MSLRLKLSAIIAFVALVPLIIASVTALRVHAQALDGATAALHGKLAEHGASVVRGYFASSQRTLELSARSIAWPSLDDSERDGALWLVYRQLPDIAVVALLDAHGEGIGSSVYREGQGGGDDVADHPPASMALLTALTKHMPLRAAQSAGFAAGEAFAVDGYSRPIVPLVTAVPGRAGETWLVVAGVALARLCDEIGAATSGDIGLYAVDPAGRTVCGPGKTAFGPAPALSAPKGTTTGRITDSGGTEKLAAASEAGGGWWAVAEQPVASAFAATRDIRKQTIFWIVVSLVIAVAAGLVLAQGISRPVAALVDAARELAKGNFAHRSRVEGGDELAELASTFNHMSSEVERRDREIRGWNAELEQRVADRTRELREAEEQLLQSQKMAAVTALGAGIAHEINNPLTGMLGVVQVLRMKLAKDPSTQRFNDLLEGAEKEGLRIKDIVERFLVFSRSQGGEQFAALDVHLVLDECLTMLKEELAASGIVCERLYGVGVPPVLANRTQLRQAFFQVLRNARQAMAAGGRLTVRTEAIDGNAVRVTIGDTGRGIAPEHLGKIFDPFFTTKDNDWRGEGLGLTVAFRTIESHHGKIKAESVLGKGTTMMIVLPVASAKAHLV